MNTLGEEPGLLASVDWLHGVIRSPKAQIQSLQRHISMHCAALVAVDPRLASSRRLSRQLAVNNLLLRRLLRRWSPRESRVCR